MVGGGVFVFFFQSVMHTQAGTRRRTCLHENICEVYLHIKSYILARPIYARKALELEEVSPYVYSVQVRDNTQEFGIKKFQA